MFILYSLLLALATQISAFPWGIDQNPSDMYQGDIKLTPDQEEMMKDRNTGVIDTASQWRMNLEGFVEVPIIFDPAANYSKLL
jgi:hypothetical protein